MLKQNKNSVPQTIPANASQSVKRPNMIFLNDINFLPFCQRLPAKDFRAPRATAAELVITHVVFMRLHHGAHGFLHARQLSRCQVALEDAVLHWHPKA
jgi:hypothetical protein